MTPVATQRRVKSRIAAPPDQAVYFASAAILVLAGSGLVFQVALTRAFSLMFQYHYVFLVVSLATLGLGIGAALGYALTRLSQAATSASSIFFSAAVLTVVFPAVAWLLTAIRASEVTVGVVIVALVPFLLIGWINALVYARHSRYSTLIYGADLVGAACGLALGPSAIILFGPFGTILAMGAVAAAAVMLFSGRGRYLPIGSVMLVALVAFTAINRDQKVIAYDPAERTGAPPDKTMIRILNDPTQNARIVETRWSAFAQIDVVETNDDSARFVFTDAGAGSIMLHYDPAADPQDYAWLAQEVAYLPFQVTPVADALIIGAGAGYDVVMARVAGAETITAVEINPAIVDITRKYGDYDGDIFDLDNVTTIVTDGRNFVDRTGGRFDLIYLNFVYSQAARPGVSSLSENYAFTTEAIRAYWDRLSPNGRMGFVMHSSVHGLRLMMTALAALEGEGLTGAEALRHMVLLYRPNPGNPTVTPSVLLIKRTAWTEEEILLLTAPATLRNLEPQYIPYVWEDNMQPLATGSMSLEEYVSAYKDYNISPTTDNRPFFYHLDNGLPPARKTLLIASALLASGYFIVAALAQPRKPLHEWTRTSLLVYFALLGGGFMLAEVTLLQHFRLLLGDPVRAFSAAVGALLLGGGVGSLFSHRFDLFRLPTIIRRTTAGIALWLFVSAIAYPLLVAAALPTSLGMRTLITIGALLPLGFLMGIPFPSGLRIADDQDAAGVPLFWGMNAVASTLGGVLASVIALAIGFHLALLLGALFYLGATALAYFAWPRVLRFA